MKKILSSMDTFAKYNFVGDWLIDKYNDDELKEEIHNRAREDLIRLLNREMDMVDMSSYLFLSLIYIGMDNYNGNFYSHLENYYEEAFENYSEQQINNRIREYIKFIRNVKEDDENRVIDYVLKESFIPQHYLSRFYKFLYDIFVIDYDYNFPQERVESDIIEETEKEIGDLLRQILIQASQTNNEEITIKVNDRYKNYILTKGTILALTDEQSLQSLIPIVVKMLNLFHADFWGENIREIALNKHLLEGFESWKKENIRQQNVGQSKTTSERQTLRPRITRYDHSKNSVVLRTRRHIINGAVDTDDFQVSVYNGKKLLLSLDNDCLTLKYTMGGIRIEPMDILVDDFLGEMKYVVTHNNREIYSTLNNLHFDYLVFDKNLNRLSIIDTYEDNALITTMDKMTTSGFDEKRLPNFYQYTGLINEKMVLHFEGSNVLLTENEAFMIMQKPVESVVAQFNDDIVDVYTKPFSLYLDVTNEDFNSLIVSVNTKNYRLCNISSPVKVGESTYATLNLETIIDVAGYYTIEYVNAENTNESLSFIYDPLYFNNYLLNENHSINQHINSSFFSYQNLHYSKESLEKEELKKQSRDVIIDSNQLRYTFNLLHDYYCINGKAYYLTRYIWFPTLKTSLIVNVSDAFSYEIISNGNTCKYEVSDGSDHITISKNDLEHCLRNSTSGIISINITKNNGDVHTLIVHDKNIYNIDDSTLITEKDALQIKIEYVGQNRMYVEYEDANGMLKKTTLPNDVFVRIPLDANREYRLKIKEGEEYNPFIENALPKEHQLLYYYHLNEESLVKNSFALKLAYIEEDSTGEILKRTVLDNLYIDANNIIHGILSYHERGSDILIPFQEINPVKVEFLGDVTIKGEVTKTPVLAYITDVDGDGLMLDKYRCTIDLDSNSRYGPINHFIMNIKGEIQ